ncbi:MAG: GNAT family N-acetyltransferase [bacterium]
METIAPKIDKNTLKKELAKSLLVRTTNFENNEIYIFNAHQCPDLMREVGRLREISFRASGGGSGKSIDIDEYDRMGNPYQQIIVWNPREEEIIGGYRYFKLRYAEKNPEGLYKIFTHRKFMPTEKFEKEYMPYTIELGKSFIQPGYQPANNPRKGVFSLDNLWDGLGAIIVDNPDVRYFYGSVSLYLHYDREARDLLLHFMNKYFADKDKLVEVRNPQSMTLSQEYLDSFFDGKGFAEDFAQLNKAIRAKGGSIPPLIKAYMSLSPSMKTFGIARNQDVGDNVEGIGILLTIDDIYPAKKRRHVESYLNQKAEKAS